MNNISLIDEKFKKYIKNINEWIPEGVIDVDLNLLRTLDLLHYFDPSKRDAHLTHYFHVCETRDKITLINDFFVVWIIPDKVGKNAITYTLIAINPANPQLELAYSTTGVYNSSRLVLRILEKYLEEIQENEEILANLKKVS